ncbi:MAG TPA: FIST N-terminal domain-containing protein [Stellaceae bacterium]|nr:FIST N-terminal domain-containing protein [Stellaceae bacterium]
MRIEQRVWQTGAGWRIAASDGAVAPALVLFFAAPGTLDNGRRFAELRALYPGAAILGCTTGGEIADVDVLDGTVVATAIEFAHTRLAFAEATIERDGDSETAGRRLAAGLPCAGLRGVFVLSDGTHVNGTDLVAGIQNVLGTDITVTGGLAGDGARFVSTRVGLNANPAPGRLAAVGFYGDEVCLGFGSFGGWDTVGPERLITRAKGTVLYELDDQPALALYRKYLGPEADNLPASALLCPLRIHPPGKPEAALVRTVIGVDNATGGMVFAGSVPEGYVAQLMLGHFDNLIAGAGRAAARAAIPDARLAILVSCIGRKLLLGQQIGDEVEAVKGVLGAACQLTGFYSYGEIAPLENSPFCDLHNQTMTITTIAEA